MYHLLDNNYFLKSKFPVIDFRSDTVSKPSEEMRKAMAEAEVGDDVYNEDPTVNRLEKMVSEMFKKEAALFVPTGTMGNLIAVLAHCDRRGCEVIMGDQSHTFLYEQGGVAQLGGVHIRTIPNLNDGTFDLFLMEQLIRTNDIHFPVTALICAENTHNMCGGKVLPLEWLDKLAHTAQKYNIPLHMDGARIFNASVSLNVPVWKITEKFDTIQFCFSKGLGAPAGSMLVGNKAFIFRARRLRKALGGGMRQVGVLAAPCIIALTSMINRLADDHKRTRRIAQAIEELKTDLIKVDLKGVHTNILMVNFNTEIFSANDFCERMALVTEEENEKLKNKSVIMRTFSKTSDVVRIVLYYEITDEDVDKVIEKLKYIVEEKLKLLKNNTG